MVIWFVGVGFVFGVVGVVLGVGLLVGLLVYFVCG